MHFTLAQPNGLPGIQGVAIPCLWTDNYSRKSVAGYQQVIILLKIMVCHLLPYDCHMCHGCPLQQILLCEASHFFLSLSDCYQKYQLT